MHPAMSLGGRPPQLIDQARDGVVDIVWTLPGTTAGRFPSLEAFELPFVPAGTVATSAALWDYAGKYAAAEFADIHPLTFWVHGHGLIHSRDKAIDRLEDIRGLKVRAPTAPGTQFLRALGAEPVSMPAPQVPEAISRGVIDATLFPWEVIGTNKVVEMVKHHTIVNAGGRGFYTAVFVLAMNKKRHAELPDDLRAILDKHSGPVLARKAGQAFIDGDVPVRKSAEERKNRVVTLDGAEAERWRSATKSVADDWVAAMKAKGLDGAGMLAAAQSLIEQRQKELGGAA
jgi:TRAP-type C4-dicarboxylate transport system substrate-binding protein